MNEFIKWILFFIPLLSLFFINKKKLVRFLPVTLFVIVVNTLLYQAAYHYNWWKESPLLGWDIFASIHWVYIAFPIATVWIFSLTYGKFKIYLFTNVLLDGIYAYIWYPFLKKVGITNGEVTGTVNFLIMLLIAMLIYLFQIQYDKHSKNLIEAGTKP
ncbi:hypothetical protein [Niallia taxi]|uniref:hypothetical protein n=1 Tax=Niallia taxi TaxID=2499688 RepID=UPI002E202B7F|nr:hypothetical protein [Niallia taxi]